MVLRNAILFLLASGEVWCSRGRSGKLGFEDTRRTRNPPGAFESSPGGLPSLIQRSSPHLPASLFRFRGPHPLSPSPFGRGGHNASFFVPPLRNGEGVRRCGPLDA